MADKKISNPETMREIIARGGSTVLPGVFDALSAHLVRQAGFEGVYASGGAISRVLGYPDIGLISMTEMATQLRYIVGAAELPVITDADTGYGGPLCVWRTTHTFGQIGIAGLHIEDQSSPKRCGHLDGKALIDTSEMVEKVIAAKEAAEAFGMLIIARTDAIAVEGFDAALDRAQCYADAGADLIFVEAPQTVEQIEEIAKALPQPKMLNMFRGGKTPYMAPDELARLGYNLVIVPSNLQRAVIGCMQTLLQYMKNDEAKNVHNMLTEIGVRDTVVDMERYVEMEQKFSARVGSAYRPKQT